MNGTLSCLIVKRLKYLDFLKILLSL